MSVASKYKKVVDVAATAMKVDKEFYGNIGLQNKCLFEIIMTPDIDFSKSLVSIAKSTIAAARDFAVVRFYLYSIQDLPLTGFEYIRYGGLQGIKDMIYPESFTATFIEDNSGTTKSYIRKWLNDIAEYDSTTKDYIFNDNQSISKRNAIIMPIQQDALPSTEWIKIDGMKIKAVTGIGYDHSSGDTELISVEFTCDTIRLAGLSLFDLL